MRVMIFKDANAAQVGTTPAHLAAKRGHAAMIKLLFIRGADCRVRSPTSPSKL